MTNPNNAVGTNGAFGGRTSVNALNDVLAAFSGSGILSGWKCVPSSGMTVQIGGQDTNIRDVAIAEDPYGNRTTINNISQAPITITLSAASVSSNRYTSIVAYVNSPTNASNTALDNPTVAGIIAVNGTATASPVVPTNAQIRTAITADGGTGSAAYYAKLADIYVEAGMAVLTDSYIVQEGMEVRLSDGVREGGFTQIADSVEMLTASGSSSSSEITLRTITVPETGIYMLYFDGWFSQSGVRVDRYKYPYAITSVNGSRIAWSEVSIEVSNETQNAFQQRDMDMMVVKRLSAGDVVTFAWNSDGISGATLHYGTGVVKLLSTPSA